MPKQDPTWIVVTDSAHARFFELRTGKSGTMLKVARRPMESGLARHARDERTDKPGRAQSSANGIRSAIEPKHDYHKLAKRGFVRKVADTIGAAGEARSFDRLVLIAPRRTLGELRKLLPANASAMIADEIAKDLTACSPTELWPRIAPLLKRDAKPVHIEPKLDGRRTEFEAALTPAVTFRHLDPSPAIEAEITRHAQKLRRVHHRIVWCRAIVDRSTAHRRKGHVYRVELEIQVPGQTIVAASAKRRAYDHEDLHAAVREAFAVGTRQLQDFAKRRSGATPQERRSSSLRSQRADAV
jgi:protein required for attachment to host cells/ribosome-associated translation inhibitor RaiA